MSIIIPQGVLRDRKYVRNQKVPSYSQAMQICKSFSEALSLIYPDHIWKVQINENLVSIVCGNVNSATGMRNIPLDMFDVEGRALMRFGGEILERFNLPRGRRDKTAEKELKRDLRGNAIPI